MTLGYIRVSTEEQTIQNQRYAILEYANKHGIKIDEWIEVKMSSRKSTAKRRVEELLEKMNEGDTLIVTELSRIGRNTAEVIGVIDQLIVKKVMIHMMKEGMTIDPTVENPFTDFITSMFAAFAQLERKLISMRTKEALAARKAKGLKLGKPKGTIQPSMYDEHRDQIVELLVLGVSVRKIQSLHIKKGSNDALYRFIRKHKLIDEVKRLRAEKEQTKKDTK